MTNQLSSYIFNRTLAIKKLSGEATKAQAANLDLLTKESPSKDSCL